MTKLTEHQPACSILLAPQHVSPSRTSLQAASTCLGAYMAASTAIAAIQLQGVRQQVAQNNAEDHIAAHVAALELGRCGPESRADLRFAQVGCSEGGAILTQQASPLYKG